jgi:tetratricopeptide (TPR) repeat protein
MDLEDASSPLYSNRAIAYLNLGDLSNALIDFQAANKCARYTTDGYLRRVGVVHWLAGRESEAVAVWRDLVLVERGKIQYSDGAGGVSSGCLLWFAAVRLKQKPLLSVAQRLLHKKVEAKAGRNWKIDNWPGPIALFLLGRIDEAALLDSIAKVPILRDREMCQAQFYIGTRELELGRDVAATQAFEEAAKQDVAKLENEYYLAKHECE